MKFSIQLRQKYSWANDGIRNFQNGNLDTWKLEICFMTTLIFRHDCFDQDDVNTSSIYLLKMRFVSGTECV